MKINQSVGIHTILWFVLLYPIFFLSISEKDPKGNSLTPVSILEYDVNRKVMINT